ncbi:MAG: non-canonical purine NTP pyrophosphatase, partial [Flavobacteriaceae bacterium]
LENSSNRNAQFKTVLALELHGKKHVFTGICKGKITASKQGKRGFGYDPIFQPNGYTQTFAEMDLELKNQIGHRGKTIKKLVEFLNSINLK